MVRTRSLTRFENKAILPPFFNGSDRKAVVQYLRKASTSGDHIALMVKTNIMWLYSSSLLYTRSCWTRSTGTSRLSVMSSTLKFAYEPFRIAKDAGLITLCTTAIALIPSTKAAGMRPVSAMSHIG